MLSTNIIIINKSGKVIQQSVIDVANQETLYKKASFKSKDNFEQKYVWSNLCIGKTIYESIAVYGKTVGPAGQENKYDFPPPIDSTLFFGNLLIVRYDKANKPINLCIDDWKSIYNTLMGGFECLDDTDDDEMSEDEEIIDKSKLDKYGYEKDGFIVDEDEDGDEEEDEISDESEESEESEEEEDYAGSEMEVFESEDDDGKELKEEEYFTKID